MTKFRVLDLFSGVGGFSLGLERTGGFETVAFCEIAEFPRKVLRKHWPEVPIYEDVRSLTADRLTSDGISPDFICGGFPCQDLSNAGKRAGIADGTRSGLWSEIDRLVGEIRPRYVFVENVTALLSGPSRQPGRWFGRVLGDLAKRGYDVRWECIPAASIGAPHIRDRVWILANAGSEHGGSKGGAYPGTRRLGLLSKGNDGNAIERSKNRQLVEVVPGIHPGMAQDWWASQSRMDRSANGVPDWMDRCCSLGNAVVPQIPELIGRAILTEEAA